MRASARRAVPWPADGLAQLATRAPPRATFHWPVRRPTLSAGEREATGEGGTAPRLAGAVGWSAAGLLGGAACVSARGPSRHSAGVPLPAALLISDDAEGRKWFHPSDSANVLSVKIASSSVGFPVNVYGTVIARDSLDSKCVYLFRCDRDHCQLISSVDESLTLIGPKRGLVLIDDIYFEMDLKIKDDPGQDDKEFSKGFLQLDGIPRRTRQEMVVESESLDSRLSTVEVVFTVVKRAVEATIAVEVLHGEFNGQITATTTSIRDSLVLYDGQVAQFKGGSIQLLRPVVAACAEESLMLNVVQVSGSGEKEASKSVESKAAVNGRVETQVTCGSCTLLAKIAWSIIAPDYLA